MKQIIKNIAVLSVILGGFMVSCDDYLEREPLDKITPEAYFTHEDHLAGYAIKAYSFPAHGGYSAGTLRSDIHTDNMASTDASYSWWVPGNRRVPNKASEKVTDDFSFSPIRNCNYFFEQVLPRFEAGNIQGDVENIKHYIGEMYFLRAWNYFSKLKLYGDFPIVKSTLPDDYQLLVEVSKRAPRNEVARFIIQDLDSAIMLMKPVFKNKNRLSSTVAQLVKSRVALYEASWLTYHEGTPFVPGGTGWPGTKVDYNKGFSIDIDAEINYFLTQAMEASKVVADAVQLTHNTGTMSPLTAVDGWNPYYDMFAAVDMGQFDEVLFWKSYNKELGITHGTSSYQMLGGDLGITKGYVDGFLMKNGLPWYAAGADYKGDQTIQKVKEGRDERLQLFLVDPTTIMKVEGQQEWGAPKIIEQKAYRDVTGYMLRKCFNYDPVQSPGTGANCTYGSLVFRAAEAYLNYIEACYMKNHSLDASAQKYWQAIRERAGIDPDYTKTINATKLELENDWGAYSAGQLVDATLFNIRRERRNEFIGENMRWDDLRRWRALDQVKNYVIEGFNLWDEMYKDKKYINSGNGESLLVEPGGSKTPNVSSRSVSKYLRPYQIIEKNNEVYNGYNWSKANYLTPLPAYDILLTSGENSEGKVDLNTSPLYQNPYWPSVAGESAKE